MTPARPAYAAGARGALAVVVPLAGAMLLGLPGGMWMGIAALNGVIADRGGAYRTRATALAVMACANAALAAVGTLAGEWLPVAAALAFLVAVGVSLTRAWGTGWAFAGVPVLLTFLTALSFPAEVPRLAEALERAGFILLGGAWAMLLTLGLWPLRPYRPVRLAVALCYRELADHLDEIGRRVAEREPLAADLLAERATAVRRAVEQARDVLASTRRGWPAETGRGARLLVLHEVADRLFVHVVALAETLEAVEPAERDPVGPVVLGALAGDVSVTLRALAEVIESERGMAPVEVVWSGDVLRPRREEGSSEEGSGAVHYAHVALLVDRMARLAATASATAAGLERGRDEPPPVRPEIPLVPEEEERSERSGFAAAAASLRAVFAPGSLLLRFSLRIGLVSATALTLTELLGLRYGYWVTITAVVILQPYTGLTTQRAVQRILGTILGGAVAAGLSVLFQDAVATLVLVALFVALSQAVLPLSYALFSVFVTPAFVLLVELGVGDWGLAWLRVLNTVVGALLALAAARLLWPQPEWNRLPAHLAAALRASGDYLRVVASVVTGAEAGDEAVGRMRDARRACGLAAINAEESFQRLLGEHGGAPARLEPAMTLLAHLRRFGNSVAALALARHSTGGRGAEGVAEVAEVAEAVLVELAAALDDARPPAPFPARPEPGGREAAPLLHARLDRLVVQLEAMHDAVARWTAAEGRGAPSSPAPRGFGWPAWRRSGRAGAPGA